jgi:hypothetical protein
MRAFIAGASQFIWADVIFIHRHYTSRDALGKPMGILVEDP